MMKRHGGKLPAAFVALDAGVTAGCFLAAFFVKKHWVLADPDLELARYRELLVIEIPFIVAVLALNGLYSYRSLLGGFLNQVRSVMKAAVQVFAVFMAISFFAKLFGYSRAIFGLFFIFMIPGLLMPRVALFIIRRAVGRATGQARRVLIFGASDLTEELTAALAGDPYYRLEVLGVAGREGLGIPQALERIEQGRLDAVVIDLPYQEVETISRIIGRAEREGVRAYLSPRTVPATLLHPSWEMVGDIPLIAFCPPDLPLVWRTAKRAMDVAFSILGLALLALALLIIAIVVKLSSPGPVLYRQRRVGLDGREFTMLKFRTMPVNAEAGTGPVWAEPGDGRATASGAFLRRVHLDELPQLFNVLAGDMSLVGPRPERPEFVSQFKAEVNRYAHKHWVRPGLTGWAQVHGWLGKTDLAERIKHDIYYIENWSLWLDVKILVLTTLQVLKSLRGRPMKVA